ncbi:MAG: hypothetical protein ACTSRH_05465 [Promethearchaeota archaeon]
MFQFKAKQKEYKLGKYKVGGVPGENPTALAGTIFYAGQKHIFKNQNKGIINKNYTEKLINQLEVQADKTNLTPLLDVLVLNEKLIEPILDFVFSITQVPILIDAPIFELKIPMINYVIEHGLDEKVIYNTITSESFDAELQLLSQTKIKTYVLLAIESTHWTTHARIKAIENLINRVKSFEFYKNQLLIDTCVIDFTSLGLALNAIYEVKDKMGFPSGCSAHNLADVWINLEKKFGKIWKSIKIVSSTITLTAGADFIFYGPVQLSNIIFPVVSLLNISFSHVT